jgi:hypothetical protein
MKFCKFCASALLKPIELSYGICLRCGKDMAENKTAGSWRQTKTTGHSEELLT